MMAKCTNITHTNRIVSTFFVNIIIVVHWLVGCIFFLGYIMCSDDDSHNLNYFFFYFWLFGIGSTKQNNNNILNTEKHYSLSLSFWISISKKLIIIILIKLTIFIHKYTKHTPHTFDLIWFDSNKLCSFFNIILLKIGRFVWMDELDWIGCNNVQVNKKNNFEFFSVFGF